MAQGVCATVYRMDSMTKLDQAASRYRETERVHEEARDAAVTAVVEALREGERPTDVTARSPFTAAYVRRIARDNGIEPAKPGPKKGATASAVRQAPSSKNGEEKTG